MDNVANGAAAVIQSVKGWASQPFRSDMNLGGWTLFAGMLIVLAVLWTMVLKDVEGVA